MLPDSRTPIVIFAQVPPPEHGQSRMVALALKALRGCPESFNVYHINTRFSDTLEDIGESSFGKLLLIVQFLTKAVRLRSEIQNPVLYYVPGPVKWSAVFRDWLLLSVLRIFYSKVVFHWHAIGHGEWAHDSERVSLNGPKCVDALARRISRCLLDRPFASISVSPTSKQDSNAVSGLQNFVICNGIEDPCPDFEQVQMPVILARQKTIRTHENPCYKILFLSHGTEEKGIMDALECLEPALNELPTAWRLEVTFAGGISQGIRQRFDTAVEIIQRKWADRITILQEGYLSGEEKSRCFANHDIFLSPSRWESFGLTVVEAMSYGMLVIATSSDGVAGVLPPNYPYVSPVADPRRLASNLVAACHALRESSQIQSGLKLRERSLALYQIKDFSENFVNAFHSMASTLAPCRSNEIPIPTLPLSVPSYKIQVYLADQNPGHDRSFGISRMSQAVIAALQKSGAVDVETVSSKTSQQAPLGTQHQRVLPWGTRNKLVRLLTDHLHPIFKHQGSHPTLHYFPKGYLPILNTFCQPSVVTIHDTIIQYDEDHYPKWRNPWEYTYWAKMLKHTLRKADRILTVSESAKRQIEAFMLRHSIPSKDITVTYEPCMYESVPQPIEPLKENYVIHLASCEPHKRSAHLIRWWHDAEAQGRKLPMLHLIGSVPPEVDVLLASSHTIVKRPFLDDRALQAAYRAARALILPSEIEGFGLPSLEAYYLGTPVCFVQGTSVEEILGVATAKGGFSLESSETLFSALGDVMAISPEIVHQWGLKLRAEYAADHVASRMLAAFRSLVPGC